MKVYIALLALSCSSVPAPTSSEDMMRCFALPGGKQCMCLEAELVDAFAADRDAIRSSIDRCWQRNNNRAEG